MTQKFTQAIVRKPGRNFSDGITKADLGKPQFEKALAQHEAYCEALIKCGLTVTILEADEKYPDGCFVEDTAVVFEEAAVITIPGDKARRGEETEIIKTLSALRKLEHIELPGTLDGGDIMRVNKHFYIGMSDRTNEEGARQFAEILTKYGYTSSQIPVKSVLHLKTGITYIGNDTFVSIDEFADCFPTSHTIKLTPDEYTAANCLLINDYLLMPQSYPKAKAQLQKSGYNIIELDISEYGKMDGGLTCLSLRW